MKMQSFIYFFIVFAMSLATDVSVYDAQDYYYGDDKPVFESVLPWKFGFTSSDWLYMTVHYWNQPPSVTIALVTYESDFVTVPWMILTLLNGNNVPVLFRQLSGPEVIVNLNLYTANGLCTSIRIAEGRVVLEKSEKEYKYTDICFKDITRRCVLVADLKDVTCKGSSNVTQNNETLKTTTPLTDLENNNTKFVSNVSSSSYENKKTSTNSGANNTETNDHQPRTQNNVLIYIIPSLIGMCVIMLVIYISIKKYCQKYGRNSHPAQTIELNTYANANEVVYADLSLMHGDSRSPRCDEESQYAEIIGVLHPH